MPEALVKVAQLKNQIKLMEVPCMIQIDGGINAETAIMALNSGVDNLVAGSFIFKNDIKKAVGALWSSTSV